MKYLYNHTSPETAYVVEDYPWGFRLRTTIRYWVESKKGYGERFCSQTINPKTGRWCAAKHSTYSPVVIMFLDEEEHVNYSGVCRSDDMDKLNAFKEKHLDNLTQFQKDMLKECMAINKVMQHVTFEVRANPMEPISLFSTDPEDVEKRKRYFDECEERQKAKKETEKRIINAINYEYSKMVI